MPVAAVFTTPAASAGTIEDIKAKGKIVIGIQAANPPWGYVDATTGNAEGIDADMGKAFAKELGVKAEFVGLEVANRIPALTAGRVDVLFATMAMLPDQDQRGHEQVHDRCASVEHARHGCDQERTPGNEHSAV